MKNELNGPRKFTPRQISEIVARYRASGLGLADFARQQNMPPGRLHYWVYDKGRTQPLETAKPSSPAPLFEEVPVAGVLPGLESWAAEVSLSRGMTVRFSASAAPGWIGSVMQALQRPC